LEQVCSLAWLLQLKPACASFLGMATLPGNQRKSAAQICHPLAEPCLCCDAAKSTATALLASPALSTAVMVLDCRFHEIQPQTGLKMLPPGASSRKIVSAIPKSVPYPVLQENTLVLSNFLVVGKRNGKLSLMFRRAFLSQHAYMLPAKYGAMCC